MTRRRSPDTGAGAVTTGEVKTNPTHPSAEWAQRRYEASLRLPPLPPCGCIRDPEYDRHRCHGEMTLPQADAVIAAAEYLYAAGLRPIFDVAQLREVWKLCPEHRNRVEELARREAA